MNKIFMVSLAALSLLISSSIFAAKASQQQPVSNLTNQNWYAAIGTNYSAMFSDHYSMQATDFSTGTMRGFNYKLDKQSWGANFAVGKRFSQRTALEGGLNYLGSLRYVDGSGANIAKINQEDMYVFYLDGYLYAPLSSIMPYNFAKRFEAFGRAGGNFFFYNVNYNASAAVSPTATNDKTTRFGANAGVGLQWNYKPFAVRALYSHIFMLRNVDYFHDIPDTINLDFVWYFA